ncbi:MAG: pro-sigmaK processing inhibitor BofA family protein [Tepidibacter sp.]|jgi:inhibitor of the pro-sigma K processing machinery|uniref:pro-sigmaK processing inhibitor BofA family protein n=1 Tax=Tepidibacter sp. TaxID=2529387 RepID=UPI0025DBD6CB|nr:pro-sigmaK processing inhibitor BofA family protein [Tepidibacter sp.]MCT4509144.1 pro-sigmaK processing inhibitor BofA family protein [Tepidibacter sp.]
MIDVLLQVKLILLYGIIILSIYTIGLLIVGPLKLVGKIGFKLMIGGLCIFILNYGFSIFNIDLNIGINLITSFCTAYLGVFGVLAMSLITYLL